VRFLGTVEAYTSAMSELGYPREQTQREIEAPAALRRLGDQQPTDVDLRRVTGRDPKTSSPTPLSSRTRRLGRLTAHRIASIGRMRCLSS
jgi:hypothetical protein